jgi:hypothetical protein
VVTARADRTFFAIQNQSAAQNLWYQFGSDAGLNAGWLLPPGAIDIYDVVVPIDGVFVWCAAAAEGFAIIEGVPEFRSAPADESAEPVAAPAAAAPAQAADWYERNPITGQPSYAAPRSPLMGPRFRLAGFGRRRR